MSEKSKPDSFIHKVCSRFFKDKRRRTFVTFGATMLLLGFIFIGIGSWKTYTANSSRIVNLRMEDIGELSTQAAYFTNVQKISNSRDIFGITVPFTQNKYIYSYDGVIKAGIDFAKLTYAIDSNSKIITVNMPEAYITSISVDEDSLVIYDESKNIFTPLKLDDIQSSRKQMEIEAVEQAIANGLLLEAAENAKILINAFLLSNPTLSDHTILWQELTMEE